MPNGGLGVGIDIGTSGARAVAMDETYGIVAQAKAAMSDFGSDGRDPATWWRTVEAALDRMLAAIDRDRVAAIAVDGTSGTVLPVDARGSPLASALMYSDPVEDRDIIEAIAAVAPADSAARGATSGLAKVMQFQQVAGVTRCLHQADWIAGQFSGRFDISDENNALKTGYDPVGRCWPDWIVRTGVRFGLLPDVTPPGTTMGFLRRDMAARFGLPENTIVVAGTTDGCASFLATGADAMGDAVTALGSSLTVKILSQKPVSAPGYGIYSHRLGDFWLAGGASNTGGKVLSHYFSAERIAELSATIDPHTTTGLDYYPLCGKGERFPIADPDLLPRLTPRPDDDGVFFEAMLEGISSIEVLGYRRLAELGAPKLRSVRTVGGGAVNEAWSAMRQSRLGVPFLAASSQEAAAGAARLALQGVRQSQSLSI